MLGRSLHLLDPTIDFSGDMVVVDPGTERARREKGRNAQNSLGV